MDSVLGTVTSVPTMATACLDTNKFLYSEENLDRRSPEMWPEQVPGVVNFISGSCSINNTEDNSLQELFQLSQDSATNHLEQSNQQIGSNSCGDSGHASGSSETASIKKYSRKFGFTDYGLASSAPERKKHKSGGSSDTGGDSDLEERGSLDDRNCESNENSSRASPVDGFAGSTSTAYSSTSKAIPSITPKVERKPKSPARTHVPDFQQGLDEEEVAMLYGFSSLPTSALLDKVKDIQNLAYQLGLEEEREMARARFLNVLGDCQASESLISGLFLNKNDLAFAEAKTLDDPKTAVNYSENSSITNGISLEASNVASTTTSTIATTTTATVKKNFQNN